MVLWFYIFYDKKYSVRFLSTTSTSKRLTENDIKKNDVKTPKGHPDVMQESRLTSPDIRWQFLSLVCHVQNPFWYARTEWILASWNLATRNCLVKAKRYTRFGNKGLQTLNDKTQSSTFDLIAISLGLYTKDIIFLTTCSRLYSGLGFFRNTHTTHSDKLKTQYYVTFANHIEIVRSCFRKTEYGQPSHVCYIIWTISVGSVRKFQCRGVLLILCLRQARDRWAVLSHDYSVFPFFSIYQWKTRAWIAQG